MNILQLNDSLLQKQGELESYKIQLEEQTNLNTKCTKDLDYIIKAQEFLQEKALEQQKRLSVRINDFISDILTTIWEDDAYTFEMKFEQKYNKTVVEMSLINDEGTTNLRKLNNIRNGGGVLDICAFGLRIALWSLKEKRSYTMILDQPFQNLDNNHMSKASELLATLSTKLGLQFIMINHNPLLADSANKTYQISKNNGISKAIII